MEAFSRDIPEDQKKVVLTQDFQNNSSGASMKEFDGFERGIPDLILIDLVNFGAFRTVTKADRTRALQEIALEQAGITSSSVALDVGRFLSAEWILAGSFTEFRGTMSIAAKFVKVSTAETFAAVSVSGPTENLLAPPKKALIKKVSLKLLSGFQFDVSDSEARLIYKSTETRSLHAALENYRGEQLVEQMEYKKALAKKQNAKADKKEIRRLKKEAKMKFKEALKLDKKYKRPKQNLMRLSQAIPMTL